MSSPPEGLDTKWFSTSPFPKPSLVSHSIGVPLRLSCMQKNPQIHFQQPLASLVDTGFKSFRHLVLGWLLSGRRGRADYTHWTECLFLHTTNLVVSIIRLYMQHFENTNEIRRKSKESYNGTW